MKLLLLIFGIGENQLSQFWLDLNFCGISIPFNEVIERDLIYIYVSIYDDVGFLNVNHLLTIHLLGFSSIFFSFIIVPLRNSKLVHLKFELPGTFEQNKHANAWTKSLDL